MRKSSYFIDFDNFNAQLNLKTFVTYAVPTSK